MMNAAMSCGFAAKAASASASVAASTASMSRSAAQYGVDRRGQSNFGNRATLLGSVLVRLMV